MKEFIEKLISRLDEKSYLVPKRPGSTGDYADSVVDIGDAISIVNQLAEEYKHCDLCYLGSPCEYQNENAVLPNELIKDNNGWIPCSERLPENISTVLVQVKEIEKPTLGWYGNMDGWRLSEKDFAELEDFTVIAWQPLPPKFEPKGE